MGVQMPPVSSRMIPPLNHGNLIESMGTNILTLQPEIKTTNLLMFMKPVFSKADAFIPPPPCKLKSLRILVQFMLYVEFIFECCCDFLNVKIFTLYVCMCSL